MADTDSPAATGVDVKSTAARHMLHRDAADEAASAQPAAHGDPPRAGPRTRASSSSSARPATSRIARSSRRSTTSGAPGLLPLETSIVGYSRRPFTDEAFVAEMHEAVKTHSHNPVEKALWDDFAQTIHYQQGDFSDPASYERLAERLDQIDAAAGCRGNRLFYLATPPSAYEEIVANLGRGRPRAPTRCLVAHRHREALRPRPRVGPTPQRRGHGRLRRVAGLPHRPLPGQGHRPQPARLPLRERHLRARLEPPLRRPRADHGRRGPRHRGPWRLLRGGRSESRHPPEPHAAAAQPRGDGAAHRLRGRRAPRREGACPAGHRPRLDGGAGACRRRPRPVRRRLGRRREGPELPGGGRGRPQDARSRPTSRCASRSRTGAGRASPSTCAPASICPARDRDRRRSSTARR